MPAADVEAASGKLERTEGTEAGVADDTGDGACVVDAVEARLAGKLRCFVVLRSGALSSAGVEVASIESELTEGGKAGLAVSVLVT